MAKKQIKIKNAHEKIFKLPKKARSTETIGFHVTFKECVLRGSTEVLHEMTVFDPSSEYVLSDTFTFSSWEALKKEYPTLKDLLLMFAEHQFWFSSWRDYDRVYFIESLSGHEGLYDDEKTVWFDAQEEFKNAKRWPA